MKKITVVFLFYCSFASAEGFRLLTKPWEASTTANIKTNKGSGDTRIDTSADGRVDAIRLQDGKTTTDIYYIDSDATFRTEQRDEGQSIITIGKIENGVAKVTGGGIIDTSKSFGSTGVSLSKKEICDKIEENLKKYKAVDVHSMGVNQTARACGSAFDENCFEEKFSGSIYNSELVQLLDDSPDSKTGIGCLSKLVNSARQEFKKSKGGEETLLRLELALSEARAEAANLLGGSQEEVIFKCESAKESKGILQPDRSIKLTQPDKKTPASISNAMFQRWGVPGNVESALAYCAKGTSDFTADLKAKMSATEDFSVILGASNPSAIDSTTVKKFAPAQVEAVNKQLAQTKVSIPSATEASPKALAKIEATQGQAAVQQVMRQQSSGILNMTNAVMAAVNTQAVAGTKTTTRSGASTSGSGSSSTASKKINTSVLKETTIGKNEKVVKQILLDEKKLGADTRNVASASAQGTRSAASIAAGTAGGNARKPANVEEATGGSGELAGGTGGGGGSSAGGSGRGSSFSPSSGGTKNNSSGAVSGQGRSTASASSSNTSDEVSGDELVSFIKNSEYASTKLKIQKDNKFRNQLKVNGITIIDKAGNFIVPGDNKVIFMDKGNRFEKQ